MYEHLLVPVDGGDLSERAMTASIELAKRLGASITGFIVEPFAPPPASIADGYHCKEAVDRHDSKVEAHAQKVLSRFERLSGDAGVPFHGVCAQGGRVDDAILAAATEHRCDMIVMLKRDFGALGDALWGSHTKRLMNRTKLPILVLH
jgi:nucleotide-binding universal stress UspA family protein